MQNVMSGSGQKVEISIYDKNGNLYFPVYLEVVGQIF